jgi:AraC-like DNA-binding protein
MHQCHHNRGMVGSVQSKLSECTKMVSSTFQTLADPEAFWAAIRAREVRGVVTARGNFRAELAGLDFQRLRMQRFTENLPRVLHISIHRERIGIVFLAHRSQPAMHISAVEASGAEIVKLDSETGSHHRSAGPLRWGSMSMTQGDLAAAGHLILGRELAPPTALQALRPPAPLLARLRNVHEAAAQLARTVPDILHAPEVARAIEEALTEAMILSLASGEPAQLRNPQIRGARVMRRLEEALQANPDRALYTTELCAAVGVSYPTLRACCQEHLGMSPRRYLWLHRMHLARRALRQADPATKTVTEIATSCGFWELGRFSVTYHSLFGEPPSATLRQPADAPQSRRRPTPPAEFAIFA